MNTKLPLKTRFSNTTKKIRSSALSRFMFRHKDACIIIALIVLKIAINGANLQHYPYFENDEATYSTRATAFLDYGKLDHYTYWYDHAPAGWMFLSIFFGIARIVAPNMPELEVGRVVMTGLSVGVTVLVYLIGRALFKRRLPAVLASIILLISPLTIYYQRRILLDNIMIFWVLMAMWLIVKKKNNLALVMLSGLLFGVAVLTKLNAVFLAPVFLLLIRQFNDHKIIRRHALVVWACIVGAVTSIWFLYAALKGELLPYSKNPANGAFEKISLFDSMRFQSSRGGVSYLPWDHRSNFYINAVDWFAKDKLLISLIAFSCVVAVLLLVKKQWRKEVGIVMLAALSLLIFIVRGGVVLGFYFIPLVPFLALIAGRVTFWFLSLIKRQGLRIIVVVLIVDVFVSLQTINMAPLWSVNETSNQDRAVEWVKKNIPNKKALIISDNYALPDLIRAGYTNVDYQFKVEYDPDIHLKKYQDDWQNGQYIILSHEVLKQVDLGVTPFVRSALDHSVLLASFTSGSTSYLDIPKYKSTNGDWTQVYQIKTREGVMLQDSWASYKNTNFRSYGQILDPTTNTTSSTNQALTMYMAVKEADKATFDGVWQWTQDHFQNRITDKLLSSTWGITADGSEGVIDNNTTSLADVQAALALITAYDRWGQEDYLADARQLIADIERVEVRSINGLNLQIAFAAPNLQQYQLNTGYGDPYAYRQFARVVPDKKVYWDKTASDYYTFMRRLQSQSPVGLIPNWVSLDQDGTLASAARSIGTTADIYGYEAFRSAFFIARDVKNGNPDGGESLRTLGSFYATQLTLPNGKLLANYSLQGVGVVDYEDVATNASALSILSTLDQAQFSGLVKEKIIGQYVRQSKSWGTDTQNIRNQQFGWLRVDQYYPRVAANSYTAP